MKFFKKTEEPETVSFEDECRGFASMCPEEQKQVAFRGFKSLYSHWPLFCFVPLMKKFRYY